MREATVGIITYNRALFVKRCLDSLQGQIVLPKKIIIIDSSDNNETEKIVRRYENIDYIHTKDRIRQPEARNRIIKRCNTEIIAFLDDDTVAEKTWLENIIKGFEFENVVGVTGPAINCNEKLEPLEKFITTSKNQNYFTPWGDVRGESRRWVPPRPVFCSMMLGANMSFLLRALKGVGGFDEHYGKHASFREETDPQISLIRKSYRFTYMPKAFVWHIRTDSGGIKDNPKKDYYYWCGKNHRYMCDKYFPKLLTRLSWILWSRNPPCLWLAFFYTILRGENYLDWHRGLWS